MKTFLILFSSAIACAMGYWAEPKLRPHVSAEIRAPKPEKPAAPVSKKDPVLEATPVKEPASLLPEKVTLKEMLQFNDQKSGLTMTIAAGSEVRLLRLQGENAIVRAGETEYTIIVPISQTDLAVRLGKEAPPVVEPAPEPEVAPEPAPVVEPEAATAPAVETPPEEQPLPETPAEPAPEVTPPAEATPAAKGPTDVVSIMRESIRNREITKFEFTQVKDWQAAADETVDGQTYQTGVLTYEAETIFGVQTLQAKAYIQNGKVTRWIWPKSGVQIE